VVQALPEAPVQVCPAAAEAEAFSGLLAASSRFKES
jgi:hypothetical protein